MLCHIRRSVLDLCPPTAPTPYHPSPQIAHAPDRRLVGDSHHVAIRKVPQSEGVAATSAGHGHLVQMTVIATMSALGLHVVGKATSNTIDGLQVQTGGEGRAHDR